MTDDGPTPVEIVVLKGTEIEIEAGPIAQIIIQNCHCSVGRAQKAADLIIDYMTAKLIASGSIDITPTETKQ